MNILLNMSELVSIWVLHQWNSGLTIDSPISRSDDYHSHQKWNCCHSQNLKNSPSTLAALEFSSKILAVARVLPTWGVSILSTTVYFSPYNTSMVVSSVVPTIVVVLKAATKIWQEIWHQYNLDDCAAYASNEKYHKILFFMSPFCSTFGCGL